MEDESSSAGAGGGERGLNLFRIYRNTETVRDSLIDFVGYYISPIPSEKHNPEHFQKTILSSVYNIIVTTLMYCSFATLILPGINFQNFIRKRFFAREIGFYMNQCLHVEIVAKRTNHFTCLSNRGVESPLS